MTVAVVPLNPEGMSTHYAQIFAVEFGEPGVVGHGSHDHRQVPAVTSHDSGRACENTQKSCRGELRNVARHRPHLLSRWLKSSRLNSRLSWE